MRKEIIYCSILAFTFILTGCSNKQSNNAALEQKKIISNKINQQTNNTKEKEKETNTMKTNNKVKTSVITKDKNKNIKNKSDMKSKEETKKNNSKKIAKKPNKSNIKNNDKKTIINTKNSSKTQTNIVKNNKQTINSQSELYYVNNNLGFSLNFPDNWKGKYVIKENKDGIDVYYKPKKQFQKKNIGCLFSIIKEKNKPEFFDTVCMQRLFKTKEGMFVIGGPTDLDFPENHEELEDFKYLKYDIGHVIKTLKVIN